MALLAICFACSIFMFSVLLFRGLLAPFTTSLGASARNRGRKRRDSCIRVGSGQLVGPQKLRGASSASGDRRRVISRRESKLKRQGRNKPFAEWPDCETLRGFFLFLGHCHSSGPARQGEFAGVEPANRVVWTEVIPRAGGAEGEIPDVRNRAKRT